jgi:hypothetical protein
MPILAEAQIKPYQGPEIAAPVRGVYNIVVHTPDSARVAYSTVVRALLSTGYGLDKQEATVGYVSTTPKLLPTGSGVRLIVQASVLPTATGSDVIFRGLFTWASVLAQGTTLENQQLPAVYVSGGNSPTQRAWNGLQQTAIASFPKGTVGYK